MFTTWTRASKLQIGLYEFLFMALGLGKVIMERLKVLSVSAPPVLSGRDEHKRSYQDFYTNLSRKVRKLIPLFGPC